MARRSPTLEGFKAIFRLPSLGLAEIAWRWSFGLAITALLGFSFREYLSTLPVTAGEMFLLRTRQPGLMFQALARIFQGSAPRVVSATIVLTLTLTLAWIVVASLGRAAALKALFEYFHESKPRSWRFASLMGLNFFRAVALFAALISYVGAMLLAGSASSASDPSPGLALLIFWMLALFISLAWSTLNWFLSLAAIFVVGDRKTTFEALGAAVKLCRTHRGPIAAVATWFGIAHAVAFMGATSAAAFPLGLAEVLPAAMVLGGLLLVALLYFAVADFLYVGRLAAFVFVSELPEVQPAILNHQSLEDDILSDVPGLPQTAGA